MTDCVFCRIVDGTIGAKIVCQDEHCLAFEDINPQAPVHVLVIPKRHIRSLNEFETSDTELLGRLLQTCRTVAHLKELTSAGYRVVANTGSQAGQTVFHFHFHVLGKRMFRWPPG
ncbi:MAG: histidine triad nucleotide-binding protein [Nitrospirae bacterium]|nr:MAG: histidine triad nucleotide-binding protein [Nitrospirota bacterium]